MSASNSGIVVGLELSDLAPFGSGLGSPWQAVRSSGSREARAFALGKRVTAIGPLPKSSVIFWAADRRQNRTKQTTTTKTDKPKTFGSETQAQARTHHISLFPTLLLRPGVISSRFWVMACRLLTEPFRDALPAF